MPRPFGTAFIIALGLAGNAAAAGLPSPAGPVLLTIDGAIATTNAGDKAEFDMDMLEALPVTTIHTSTPWTSGLSTFEGVSLADLLAAVGAEGVTIRAAALNDYAADIPASDADLGALVAFKLDGALIPVREKGPLWIVYPLDDRPELKSETIYARCVWQLVSLTVQP